MLGGVLRDVDMPRMRDVDTDGFCCYSIGFGC